MNQDQWLENLLSQQAPLEDAGFTARVMAQLPQDAAEKRDRNIVVGSSIVGCLLAAPFVLRIPACTTSLWLCPPVLIAAFITVAVAGVMLWEQSEVNFFEG